MAFVNKDVIPFVELARSTHQKLTVPPEWPVDFIYDLQVQLNEFMEQFKAIQPEESWSSYKWRKTAYAVRVALQTIKPALSDLPDELPQNRLSANRPQVLKIIQQNVNVIASIRRLEESIKQIIDSDDSRNIAPGVTDRFLRNGRRAAAEMETMIDLFPF